MLSVTNWDITAEQHQSRLIPSSVKFLVTFLTMASAALVLKRASKSAITLMMKTAAREKGLVSFVIQLLLQVIVTVRPHSVHSILIYYSF